MDKQSLMFAVNNNFVCFSRHILDGGSEKIRKFRKKYEQKVLCNDVLGKKSTGAVG